MAGRGLGAGSRGPGAGSRSLAPWSGAGSRRPRAGAGGWGPEPGPGPGTGAGSRGRRRAGGGGRGVVPGAGARVRGRSRAGARHAPPAWIPKYLNGIEWEEMGGVAVGRAVACTVLGGGMVVGTGARASTDIAKFNVATSLGEIAELLRQKMHRGSSGTFHDDAMWKTFAVVAGTWMNRGPGPGPKHGPSRGRGRDIIERSRNDAPPASYPRFDLVRYLVVCLYFL